MYRIRAGFLQGNIADYPAEVYAANATARLLERYPDSEISVLCHPGEGTLSGFHKAFVVDEDGNECQDVAEEVHQIMEDVFSEADYE